MLIDTSSLALLRFTEKCFADTESSLALWAKLENVRNIERTTRWLADDHATLVNRLKIAGINSAAVAQDCGLRFYVNSCEHLIHADTFRVYELPARELSRV